jgi:hypothetical protein
MLLSEQRGQNELNWSGSGANMDVVRRRLYQYNYNGRLLQTTGSTPFTRQQNTSPRGVPRPSLIPVLISPRSDSLISSDERMCFLIGMSDA